MTRLEELKAAARAAFYAADVARDAYRTELKKMQGAQNGTSNL
jgi:hypothetical protein